MQKGLISHNASSPLFKFSCDAIPLSSQIPYLNSLLWLRLHSLGFPTERPKSVRNYCVIEIIGGVFVLSRCFLKLSVVDEAFVIGYWITSLSFSLIHSQAYQKKNPHVCVILILMIYLFPWNCNLGDLLHHFLFASACFDMLEHHFSTFKTTWFGYTHHRRVFITRNAHIVI